MGELVVVVVDMLCGFGVVVKEVKRAKNTMSKAGTSVTYRVMSHDNEMESFKKNPSRLATMTKNCLGKAHLQIL